MLRYVSQKQQLPSAMRQTRSWFHNEPSVRTEGGKGVELLGVRDRGGGSEFGLPSSQISLWTARILRQLAECGCCSHHYIWILPQLQPGCWHGVFDSRGLLCIRVNTCQLWKISSFRRGLSKDNVWPVLRFFQFCFCQSHSSSTDVKRGCETEAQGQVPPLSPPGKKGGVQTPKRFFQWRHERWPAQHLASSIGAGWTAVVESWHFGSIDLHKQQAASQNFALTLLLHPNSSAELLSRSLNVLMAGRSGHVLSLGGNIVA